MDGVNYLVPVDARLERDVDVRFETVTIDEERAPTALRYNSPEYWPAGQLTALAGIPDWDGREDSV